MMNLTGTSAQTQSIPTTCSYGGLSESTATHAYHAWHWTTSQSLVCNFTCDIAILCSLPSVATSVDVERVFSKGRILLSHVRNQLSVQSTRALMCLGAWSLMGYVKDRDLKEVTVLPDLKEGEKEEPLADNWDLIT
jgi:hypothetical protein